MKPKETKSFEILYDLHMKKFKLQGKSEATIKAYSRAVRLITKHFDCCPEHLTTQQFDGYRARECFHY